MLTILASLSYTLSASNFGDRDHIDLLEYPMPHVIVIENAESSIYQDAMNFVQISSYLGIQSLVLDDIFSDREHVEVLDICAGDGSFLRNIFNDNRFKSSKRALHYTAVEQQEEHAHAITQIWNSQKKPRGSKGGIAHKRLDDYFSSNSEAKLDKFDIVFGGFALHIFYPIEYIDALYKLYSVMKPGAKLYITQQSFSELSYSSKYINAVKEGVKLPFWRSEHFTSDPIAMKALIEDFGFELVSSQSYLQIHGNGVFATRYLALVIQKPLLDRRDEEKIAEYKMLAEVEQELLLELRGLKDRS